MIVNVPPLGNGLLHVLCCFARSVDGTKLTLTTGIEREIRDWRLFRSADINDIQRQLC